eukprot:TRINITY_DN102175_c0_g1_i1.p1 TRINITY_DN102175_c0_g1~~TRINITY_DN102175_c0_g1_i1.p1  ORF type:complete len:689 (+),score=151.53 TRINITY_DN102175_c0_g1_i1:102-2168(+)
MQAVPVPSLSAGLQQGLGLQGLSSTTAAPAVVSLAWRSQAASASTSAPSRASAVTKARPEACTGPSAGSGSSSWYAWVGGGLLCRAVALSRRSRTRRRHPRVVVFGSEGVEVSDALGKDIEGDVILIGWDPGPQDRNPEEPPWSAEESLEELETLCRGLDLIVREKVLQKWRRERGKAPLGKGKLQELKEQCKNDRSIGAVIFDMDLTVRQVLAMKGRISPDGHCLIMDRTSLILRIFADRARTNEARLQVTLASQRYMLPRLRAYLTEGGGLEARGGSAAGGSGRGGGSLKGAGETQLSKDQFLFRQQISQIKAQLRALRKNRMQKRNTTKEYGLPIVALVGYTNAGKSTLLNRLHGSVEVESRDRLFETLDTTRRKVKLPTGREAFVIDTVGFIQRLPQQLVEGFRATLEELTDADLILHVVDVTSSTMYQQVGTVEKTLRELENFNMDTPQLLVFNKADKLEGGVMEELLGTIDFPWASIVGHCQISARTGMGVDALSEAIEDSLVEHTRFGGLQIQILIPYNQPQEYAKLHGPPPIAKIIKEEHTDEGYLLDLVASPDCLMQFRHFEVGLTAEQYIQEEEEREERRLLKKQMKGMEFYEVEVDEEGNPIEDLEEEFRPYTGVAGEEKDYAWPEDDEGFSYYDDDDEGSDAEFLNSREADGALRDKEKETARRLDAATMGSAEDL